MYKATSYSSISTKNSRPNREAFGGHLYADMKYVVAAGLQGIRDSMEPAKSVLALSIQAVSPFPAVYTGKMKSKWKTKYNRKGGYIESGADYSVIMDTAGAKPHMPPYTPIAKWVAKKTNAPVSYVKLAQKIRFSAFNINSKNRRKKLVRNGKLNLSEKGIKKYQKKSKRRKGVRQFAAIVQGLMKKIASRGLKPRNFSKPAMKTIADITLAHVMRNIDHRKASSPLASGKIAMNTVNKSSDINGAASTSTSTWGT